MTATEFHIASALQPLHAGGVHICLADDAVWGEPVSPVCQPVDTLAAVDKAVVDKPAEGLTKRQIGTKSNIVSYMLSHHHMIHLVRRAFLGILHV
jgi:hypothetical protein